MGELEHQTAGLSPPECPPPRRAPLHRRHRTRICTRCDRRPGNVASFPALADVVSVSADGNDLVFDLSRPSATLPEALIVPLDKGDHPVGTGPYHVVQQEESTATLEAFDRYYQGMPTIDRVIVKTFDKLRPTWASLLRGELDVVYDVPADAVEFVRNDDIDVVSVPRWYQHLLTLNANDKRFKAPLVRKALGLAVDREAIIRKVLHGAGEPSAGPIYPRYWAFDSSVPNYSFDPAGAAALLDAAGYRMPKASGATAPPARFRFTCLLPKDFTVWERIALEVQRDLLNIGVDMQFKVIPMLEFNDLVFSGRFEAAFIDIISGPTPSRTYIWWRSAKAVQGPNRVRVQKRRGGTTIPDPASLDQRRCDSLCNVEATADLL